MGAGARAWVRAEGRTPQAAKVLATGQWSAPAGSVGLRKVCPMGGYHHTVDFHAKLSRDFHPKLSHPVVG